MSTDKTAGLNGAMAAQIRAERSANNFTVQGLADAIGVSKSKMLYILKPSVIIDLSEVAALAEVFGLDPIELMRRAQDRLKGHAGS